MAQQWNAEAVRLSRRATLLLAGGDLEAAQVGLLRAMRMLPALGARVTPAAIGLFVAFGAPPASPLPPLREFEEMIAALGGRGKETP